MNEIEQIKASMVPLIERARQQKLWLFSSYQGLWFSPDELVKAQNNGRFLWSPENWTLRDPYVRIAELTGQIQQLQSERDQMVRRI